MTLTPSSTIALLIIGAVAGALLYSTHQSEEPASAPAPPIHGETHTNPSRQDGSDDLTAQLETLEEELNQYRDWTWELENQLRALEDRLGVLEAAAKGPPAASASQAQPASPPADEQRQTPRDFPSVDTLVDNGMDPRLAAELVARNDRLELQKLELRDRTIRDGTYGQRSYLQALRKLNQTAQNLREELGDADYDRYLYSLGKTNRVGVTSVIAGSAAEQSGLRDGDIILAYDNTRIFDATDLRRFTSQGLRNEYVLIEIQRDNLRMTLSVPRGPLGVRMVNLRDKPSGY